MHRRYNVALPTPPKYCALLIIELVAGVCFCALEILTALEQRGHIFKAINIISRFWNSRVFFDRSEDKVYSRGIRKYIRS